MSRSYRCIVLAVALIAAAFVSLNGGERSASTSLGKAQTGESRSDYDSLYPIQEVGRFNFPVLGSVHPEGNYIYSPNDNGLIVVDVSDPTNPVIVNQMKIEGGAKPWSVDISGNYLYMVRNLQPAFTVMDLTDPVHPVIVASCTLAVYCNDLKVSGSTALVAAHDGLLAVDISNPLNPDPVGFWPSAMNISRIQIVGNHAYLAAHDDIDVVDISDPANMQTVSVYPFPSELSPQYFALSGNTLYVVQGDSGVAAFDISNRAMPATLGFFAARFPGMIAASGSYVYLSKPACVIDFSDPAAPLQVATFPTSTSTLAKEGDNLYICSSGRLDVWNVAVPTSPVSMGDLPFQELNFPGNLALTGNTVAVVYSGLSLIDISNPAAPVLLSTFVPQGDKAQEVEAIGNLVYLTDANWLNILDISDPSNPALLSSTEVDVPFHLDVQGNIAVTGLADFMDIIDVSDPVRPVVLSQFRSSELWTIEKIKLIGNRAYVIVGNDFPNSLAIMDLSQPTNPSVIGRYQPTPSTVIYGMEVVNDTAYLSLTSYRTMIVDCTNPAAPKEIGTCWVNGAAKSLARQGDFLFSATNEVSVIDLYNPQRPQQISNYWTGNLAHSLAVRGDYAYVMGSSYVSVLQMTPPTFMMGDANTSGAIDISDVVFLINYIFGQGGAPYPYRQGDVNCDRGCDISDAVYLIQYIFSSGSVPCVGM